MEEERGKQLLMGLIDGELTDEETREINELLRRNSHLRDELEIHKQTNKTLNLLHSPNLDEAMLRRVWKSPFRKSLRMLSYGMIGLGFATLLGVGIIKYLQSGEGSFLVNVCVGGIGLGMLLLFVQVIRDRLIVYKNDPYKDIEK